MSSTAEESVAPPAAGAGAALAAVRSTRVHPGSPA
jgi:hypothetical protein